MHQSLECEAQDFLLAAEQGVWLGVAVAVFTRVQLLRLGGVQGLRRSPPQYRN